MDPLAAEAHVDLTTTRSESHMNFGLRIIGQRRSINDRENRIFGEAKPSSQRLRKHGATRWSHPECIRLFPWPSLLSHFRNH
jgi:hypothetical protein